MPPVFQSDLNRQWISSHIVYLRNLGYEPADISSSAKRLRDLYCARSGTYFECKTDSHKPRNVCIELAGNLLDLPDSVRGVIRPSSAAYQIALEYLRDIYYRRPEKASVGFSGDLSERHLLSYRFLSGDHLLLDIRGLQGEIVLPALRETRYPLLASPSRDDCGNCWHSLSLLVPCLDAGTVAAPALRRRGHD